MKLKISGILLSTTVLLSCTDKKAETTPPNIIYILADDLGYGDLGCYGQKLIRTPNIDRMATEGMQFMQHYAGCSVSAPSRGSLMTGLHTGHSQIRGNKEIEPEGQQPMQAGTFTLGKMMQSAGYKTGLFGKWGLGYPDSESTPNKMGFDEFYGYNCQRMAHTYYPEHIWQNENKIILEDNQNGRREVYSQNMIHQQGLRFIRENKDKPFMVMLTYTLPHAELNLPHNSIYKQYENKFNEEPYAGAGSYHSVEKPKASFAAMVSQLDLYVGEVLAELEALGISENTIVMFTSDNGPHQEGGADPQFFKSSGPLKGIKRDLYEGGIRVPFIVRYKGKIEGGQKSDHISAFWDMMPTFLELSGANISIPEDVETDGISLVPTLLGNGKQKEHNHLYWEFHEMGGRIAVRQQNWKAVLSNAKAGIDQAIELYDLANDIHEDNNIAKEYPEKVEELRAIMKKEHKESAIFPFLN